ncbi:MAG: SigB/SigF/SigG family RNA polymerase sigma factor [Solirubrobacterales bacterium]|nr:SigB/SigF/SigG family RNA polymerase sigma factor [Solirubrobacterales bacterium]
MMTHRLGDTELFERYRRDRDPRDREELVARFMPLARKLALRYQRPSQPFDDLVQVASLGLLNAIDRFEPERGLAFSSYAIPTILGELKRYFRDRTWWVRVPRDLQERTLAVAKVAEDLALGLHRAPTVPEIAAQTRLTDAEVLEALEASGAHRADSLDVPVGEDADSITLGESLGDDERGFQTVEDRVTLGRLMGILTPREREILRLRFEHDMTQAEIGERIGVSQMQVSRLVRSAVSRLTIVAKSDELKVPA